MQRSLYLEKQIFIRISFIDAPVTHTPSDPQAPALAVSRSSPATLPTVVSSAILPASVLYSPWPSTRALMLLMLAP